MNRLRRLLISTFLCGETRIEHSTTDGQTPLTIVGITILRIFDCDVPERVGNGAWYGSGPMVRYG